MKRIKDDSAVYEGLDLELQNDATPGQVLRALASILPDNTRLLLEGSSIHSDIEAMYKRLQCAKDRRIPRDYISKKVPAYYLPATYDLLTELADLYDSREGTEIADHIKLYDEQGILFSWHDICISGYPVLFSTRLGKDILKYFHNTYQFDIRKG